MPFNEIQVSRFNAILHKLLSMKEGSPAPLLATEIFPMVVLENDRPEWKFLGNEYLAMGSATLAASALNFSAIQLFNPPGSGALVVLEQIQFHPKANSREIIGGPLDSILTGSSVQGTQGYCDGRAPRAIGAGAATIYSANTSAVSPLGALLNYRMDVLNTDGFATPMQFCQVLPPGTGYVFQSVLVNQVLSMNLFWRERALEPSETR